MARRSPKQKPATGDEVASWFVKEVLWHPKAQMVLATAVMTIFCILILNNMTFEKTGNFSLKSGREFEVNLDIDLEKNYSPTCGCLQPQYGKWSGFSFASRHVSVHPANGESITFDIFNGMPGALIDIGGGGVISGTEYRVSRHSSQDPPFYFIDSSKIQFPRGSLLSEANLDKNKFTILREKSAGPINIISAGEFPISSWNPTTDSTVIIKEKIDQITYETSILITDIMKPNSKSPSYVPGSGANIGGGRLDIGGKYIYIWFQDPKKQNITVLYKIIAPFSLVMQMRTVGLDYEKGSYLGIEAESIHSSEYEEIRLRRAVQPFHPATYNLETSRIVDSKSNESWSSIGPMKMQMRLPDLPPARGFNLYGNMKRFSSRGTFGSVSIGSKVFFLENSEFSFVGDAKATLMEIREFLPLSFNNNTTTNLVNFNGFGVIHVGGEKVTSIWFNISEFFNVWQVWMLVWIFVTWLSFLLYKFKNQNGAN